MILFISSHKIFFLIVFSKPDLLTRPQLQPWTTYSEFKASLGYLDNPIFKK